MKKKELETRFYSVSLETREENGAGVITGRPIVFGVKTDLGIFDEYIEAGALDDANLSDVRLCLNHDTSYVYARSRRNNPKNTMNIYPNREGLDIEANLAIDESPKAQDFFSAIKRGDIDKMSFMFSIDEERWEDLESDHPTRVITKIGSVVEVRAVTFPAYDTTSINARSRETLENARLELENARARSVEDSAEADIKTNELELLKEKTKILGGIKP